MRRSNLEETLEHLRNCGDHLVKYNFPKSHPLYEDYIYPLKISEVEVDGYTVGLHYSKADYGEHFLESLQIFGVNFVFLPFHLVTKIAIKALGGHHLSLIKVPRDGKIYYCWTCCVDKSGKAIPCQYEIKQTKCEFEGLEFGLLSADSVNFH